MSQLTMVANQWFGLKPVTEFIAAVFNAYKQYIRYRDTVTDLSMLSDSELKDIGINRGDIHAIAMEVYYDNR